MVNHGEPGRWLACALVGIAIGAASEYQRGREALFNSQSLLIDNLRTCREASHRFEASAHRAITSANKCIALLERLEPPAAFEMDGDTIEDVSRSVPHLVADPLRQGVD